MDEGGTLDFEDLMDTGDEFPGFEIAKFTPANESLSNDDSVLRTPEHEKEDEDYLHESRNNHKEKAKEDINDKEDTAPEVNSVEDIVNSIEGVYKDDISQEMDNNTVEDTVDKSEEDLECNDVDMTIPDEAGDNKPDKQSAEGEEDNHTEKETKLSELTQEDSDDIEIIEDNSNNEDKEEQSEPMPKKKKMFLKPPQKKMSLMGSLKKKEKEADDAGDDIEIIINEDSGRDTPDNDESSKDDSVVIENGDSDDNKNEGRDEGKNGKKDEEEPHQQSFLSFLNLKPGASKPKETGEREKEETLQKEFYSRKRLRTRKKVSYCEDVEQDDDDEFNIEEEDEEDDADHQFDMRRGSIKNNKVRRNSATSNYANALQNLLPGVDLSYLQRKPVQVTPSVNNLVSKPVIMDNLKSQGNLKGLFECGICGVFFNTAAQFIMHQEAVHAGQKKNGRSAMETFRCEICGFVLTNRFAYLEHKKMKHNKSGTYSCSKCKINKFTDIATLQKHQQVCGVPFCSTCGDTFISWVDVAEHRKKVHTPSAPIRPTPVPTRQWLNCGNQLCTFKCVTQHELKQHIESSHMSSLIFTCNAPRCSQTFPTREKLTEHKKEVHASEFIVQYQCMECKNCFSSKTLLAEHQYLHTLEKLRKCDLCLRQFTNVNDLRKHKDVHAVKGTARCQSCMRWCVDKMELVNHVCAQKRRNIGIRLYFCDVCHKDFRSDEKMFQHRKEHKNFFQCNMCLQEFNSESEYFVHREVHGKFTCKECCEELEKKDVEMHAKAHRYYIKLEDIENNGKNEKAMFLCPNLFNAIQA